MNSQFFTSNRTKLKKLAKSKLIIITGNILIQKTLDQAYPFKQDNNFWYLTGVDEPQFILVMNGSEEFLIAPKLSKTKTTFDGALNLLAIAKTSGIDQILDENSGWQKVKSLLSSSKTVATIVPKARVFSRYGIYPSPARKLLTQKIKRIKSSIVVEDLTLNMAALRITKQPEELKTIKKAIEITNDTLIEALDQQSLASLTTAKELEAVINFGFISRGASSGAFDPIVAQGKSATTIHYTKNDQNLNPKELLLIDVGCEYDHYCSDISRTICLDTPSPRQQAVYDAVSEVQQQAFKLVKSGMMMKEFENEVEKLIGQQLIELGLIKKMDKKAIRRYYPHNASHSLGLDVHDFADYSKPLPEGSVITVEPGIYIPEESIGVRLEDDVLVERNGCQVLSRSLPSRLCYNSRYG